MLSFYGLFALGNFFLFYSDPGTGALILQLLAGVFLGGIFYLRKFKDLLFKKRAPENLTEPNEEKIEA